MACSCLRRPRRQEEHPRGPGTTVTLGGRFLGRPRNVFPHARPVGHGPVTGLLVLDSRPERTRRPAAGRSRDPFDQKVEPLIHLERSCVDSRQLSVEAERFLQWPTSSIDGWRSAATGWFSMRSTLLSGERSWTHLTSSGQTAITTLLDRLSDSSVRTTASGNYRLQTASIRSSWSCSGRLECMSYT